MKKISKLIFALAVGVATASCANAERYKVQAPMPDEYEGATVYMINFDSGEKIDSTVVKDKVAVFSGEIDEPILARLVANGDRMSVFILEGGSISFKADNNQPFGSMLNDRLTAMYGEIETISNEFQAAEDDSTREAVQKKYDSLMSSVMDENSDNPLGFYVFLNEASQYSAKELRDALDKYPYFNNFTRSKSLLEQAERREKTQPGNKFVDFEVTYDGKTSRLSDYVGKGHYVLVDFWASWCGPCIRQTKVLKELYNEYKDKGLEVLGVAVWDEPENTKAAIKQHELPWECILDAQTIPTDLYGITGIPCIILFSPDGTIISRDKQDDDLRADVRAAMDGK